MFLFSISAMLADDKGLLCVPDEQLFELFNYLCDRYPNVVRADSIAFVDSVQTYLISRGLITPKQRLAVIRTLLRFRRSVQRDDQLKQSDIMLPKEPNVVSLSAYRWHRARSNASASYVKTLTTEEDYRVEMSHILTLYTFHSSSVVWSWGGRRIAKRYVYQALSYVFGLSLSEVRRILRSLTKTPICELPPNTPPRCAERFARIECFVNRLDSLVGQSQV